MQISKSLKNEVLEEHGGFVSSCLRQIVDKITLEFDRFAIVLGISTAYRNKARVNSKANIMQQKFEILREWKRKNIDSGCQFEKEFQLFFCV